MFNIFKVTSAYYKYIYFIRLLKLSLQQR